MHISEKAFVLKKQVYGESDLIVTCLNSAGNRFSVFARAALRSKKRFVGGVLEPTHYISVTYDIKKIDGLENELGLLREASLLEDFSDLRENYDRLQMAMKMTKAISTVAREGQGPDSASLFNLYGNSLRALATSDEPELIWALFLTKLLHGQGILSSEASYDLILQHPMAQWKQIGAALPLWKALRGHLEQRLQEYIGKPL